MGPNPFGKLGMTAQSPVSEKLSDQALVVYKALHEQISFLKKQQWTITNYLVLLYAAVFAVKREISPQLDMMWFLRIVTAIGALYGLWILMAIQFDLMRARERLDRTDKAIFSRTEFTQLNLKNEHHPFFQGLSFTIALVGVVVVGAVLVILTLR
jgi:DNA integrity scanning protein DisA with diadenylate cyclase activity